jgi:hypothetical protein
MAIKIQTKNIYLLIFALGLLAVTGCGGGGDAKSGSVSAKSKTASGSGTVDQGAPTDQGSSGNSGQAEESEAAGKAGTPKKAGAPRKPKSKSKPTEGKEAPEKQKAPAPPSHSGQMTKARFVEQAEKICKQGREGILAAVGAYIKEHRGQGSSASETAAAALKAEFLPSVQDQIDKLRALDVPEGDEAEVQAILDSMQVAVDTGKESSGNSSAEISKPFAKSGSLARQYGLSACAYG